ETKTSAFVMITVVVLTAYPMLAERRRYVPVERRGTAKVPVASVKDTMSPRGLAPEGGIPAFCITTAAPGNPMFAPKGILRSPPSADVTFPRRVKLAGLKMKLADVWRVKSRRTVFSAYKEDWTCDA